jgi:hypothetical protein
VDVNDLLGDPQPRKPDRLFLYSFLFLFFSFFFLKIDKQTQIKQTVIFLSLFQQNRGGGKTTQTKQWRKQEKTLGFFLQLC